MVTNNNLKMLSHYGLQLKLLRHRLCGVYTGITKIIFCVGKTSAQKKAARMCKTSWFFCCVALKRR